MNETTTLASGVILFCAGTLLGIPHGLSKKKQDAENTELWRVAHLSTCVGGIAVMALAPALNRLLGESPNGPLTLFVTSAYLFFFACSLSAALNAPWHGNRSRFDVKVVYWLQIAASAFSVLSVAFTLTCMGARVW